MIGDQILRLVDDGDEFTDAQVAPRELGDQLPPERMAHQSNELGQRRTVGHAHPADITSNPIDAIGSSAGNQRLRRRYSDSALVSRATRASSWKSADAATSSSDPSRAVAARPALASIRSAILVSMVWAAMMRHAVTGSA